jgi:putative membrane protein
MRIHKNDVRTCLARVAKTGATLGAALFAASALQARNTDDQTPAAITALNQTPTAGQILSQSTNLAPNTDNQTPAAITALNQEPTAGQSLLQSPTQAPNANNQTPAAITALNQAPWPGQNSPQSSSTDAPPDTLSRWAKAFLKGAAQAELTEIAMANMAERKSQNPRVKTLAQLLRNEHQRDYVELQSVCKTRGVILDPAPDGLKAREIDDLKLADPADFDKEYTAFLLKDYVRRINVYEKAAAVVGAQDVNEYAQHTLSSFRTQLQRSEEVARAVGVAEATISTIRKDLPIADQVATRR